MKYLPSSNANPKLYLKKKLLIKNKSSHIHMHTQRNISIAELLYHAFRRNQIMPLLHTAHLHVTLVKHITEKRILQIK